MKHTSFLFLCLFILFSCSDKASETIIKKKEKADQITLIFNKPVRNGYYEIPGSNGSHQYRTENGDEIQFIDDNLIDQRLPLNIGSEKDTVIIKTGRDLIEVRLMYKGVDNLKYLFQSGDTIEFNYNGIKPIARVLNRTETYEVTNFSLIQRDSLAFDEYTAMDIMKLPVLLNYRAKNLPRDEYLEFVNGIEPNARKNLPEELERTYSKLESLQERNQINKQQFNYRLTNIYFQLTELLASPLNKKGVESDKFSTLSGLRKELLNRYPNLPVDRSDSLFFNSSFSKYFDYSSSIEFSSKVDQYKYKTETAGGRITNYPRAYDSVQVASHLSQIEKKKLHYYYVEYIFKDAGYFPIEIRWEYLNKFKNQYQDTAMVNHLINKYNIKFSIGDDLELINLKKESTSLEALVASNQDKVIYVDFWASWCAPCIKEMPYSKKIQTEFDSDQLIYVYLSADRKDLPWENAIKRHELNTGLHFRIENAGYTTKMEELNIPALPHYMIYHNGRLVNKDAPRPSEREKLIAEFNRYLGKQ
ncbi:TlpA disulfide reductase family protein [Roseivirga sp. UBA1976]|uniref:TlpA family protein disulfide reductase n=1 Tax=Roseivirga sp. UBA1976 TaxID=1947386 RepID=UPI00257B0FBB|nr:TlpA disulfide reductase family protein [Roseivirga sp. UBA1976]MEC7754198.1 TlpA disulfide reductase family protein [Bacteroidota bacterium]